MTNYTNWLNKNYNYLLEVSKKLNIDEGEEILNFTIDKLYTGSKVNELPDNEKMLYTIKSLRFNHFSNTSQYYREVKRWRINTSELPYTAKDRSYEEINEMETKERMYKFIEEELSKMNWFHATLFRKYAENNFSARDLAETHQMALSTVQYHLKKVRDTIKNKWKNQN